MKVEFQPVRKRLDFGEYAPEHTGIGIYVQVSVSRAMMGRLRELWARLYAITADTPRETQAEIQAELLAVLSEIWGPTEWPVDDVRALMEQCLEYDPQLWYWAVNRTWALVIEHQGLIKKK